MGRGNAKKAERGVTAIREAGLQQTVTTSDKNFSREIDKKISLEKNTFEDFNNYNISNYLSSRDLMMNGLPDDVWRTAIPTKKLQKTYDDTIFETLKNNSFYNDYDLLLKNLNNINSTEKIINPIRLANMKNDIKMFSNKNKDYPVFTVNNEWSENRVSVHKLGKFNYINKMQLDLNKTQKNIEFAFRNNYIDTKTKNNINQNIDSMIFRLNKVNTIFAKIQNYTEKALNRYENTDKANAEFESHFRNYLPLE